MHPYYYDFINKGYLQELHFSKLEHAVHPYIKYSHFTHILILFDKNVNSSNEHYDTQPILSESIYKLLLHSVHNEDEIHFLQFVILPPF